MYIFPSKSIDLEMSGFQSFFYVGRNVVAWFSGSLIFLGLASVIVNLILLIIFRKSEKKSKIKNILYISLVAMIAGICCYLFFNLTQETLCGGDVVF